MISCDEQFGSVTGNISELSVASKSMHVNKSRESNIAEIGYIAVQPKGVKKIFNSKE